MSVEEKRIREFAYQIWESEGKPEGHESRHWEMARKLAEAEALAPKASTAKKPKASVSAKPKAAPAPTASKTATAKSEPAKKPRTPKKPAPL
ncbi:DUF2934 domain-containing protein [Pseudomonas sp. Marseille-P9899]|uniref:DUF2934 domain-containing protein n=1 Tax=Pseudomonas sp. Marseille-P9899 TaxID=2730401 RepID=UPI00158E65ED|nr:DUF2934 domain-containing protein [Pseudomonas sp. Marseille-P9899]